MSQNLMMLMAAMVDRPPPVVVPVPEPAANEQTFNLGSRAVISNTSTSRRMSLTWDGSTASNLLNPALVAGGAVAYLVRLELWAPHAGLYRLAIETSATASGTDAAAGIDLTDQFESNWTITIAQDTNTWEFSHDEFVADATEPYFWNTSDATAQARLFAAFNRLRTTRGGTITLNDNAGSAPEPVTQPDASISRTLDRTFGNGNTPASGGGNVTPDSFEYEGDTWEVWQVIPFLGTGVVSGDAIGDCRVQLRNREISRSAMQLADMPARVVIRAASGQTSSDWTGLPWEFTRPTSNSKFTSPGSGNSARRAIDYEPAHTPGANAAALGIAQGETFTIDIYFD